MSTPPTNRMECTKDTCGVEYSVYGYYPSQPVTIILIALFAISCGVHLFQGIKYKSWTFMIGLAIGTFMEAVGYVGRILLRNDPFSRVYIAIQLICLTIAPAFIAAGVYLTLKHLVIIHGARFSRIAPKWYTWVFISCDVISIIIQSVGAVLASGSGSSSSGNNVIIFGLAFQVFTLLLFGLLSLDVYSRIHSSNLPTTGNSKKFGRLVIAIVVAYTTILIRCIYRIAEMAGGWRNPIMQDQVSFIILDGVMCILAVGVLNWWHPGFMFEESYLVGKKGSEGSEEDGVTMA